jgi:uncharacterized surface anchored protein
MEEQEMRRKFVSALIALMLMAGTAVGQSTFGSIVGVVQDKTQAVVPGASVRLQSLNDNSTRTAISDQHGAFEFVNLKPGRYALFVEAQGFQDFKVGSAELTARQALRVDVTMNVKSQSETVEVSDNVPA